MKLPSLNIPTFDGESTKWKSYWQQFESTIHNSKKLDDQLQMQYLLKSLTTQKAKDAIEGIDSVAVAYPEAIAALKARFDRLQVIHRAHVRALLHKMLALLRMAQAPNSGNYMTSFNIIFGPLKQWTLHNCSW